MFGLLLLVACTSGLHASLAARATGATHQSSALISKWDEYVRDVKAAAPRGLQSDCIPRRFAATSAFVGTAVLFHGFRSAILFRTGRAILLLTVSFPPLA